MTDTTTHEPFINEREAAKFLNISPRTLQRWRTEPHDFAALRFYRIGRRVVYRYSDLVEWVENQASEPTNA